MHNFKLLLSLQQIRCQQLWFSGPWCLSHAINKAAYPWLESTLGDESFYYFLTCFDVKLVLAYLLSLVHVAFSMLSK